jgi:uncharacterized Zn finger protein (UPF0148 family)
MSDSRHQPFELSEPQTISVDFLDADSTTITTTRFPCQQCGALLTFKIGSDLLECPYCGHENQIIASEQVIDEKNLHEALLALDHTKPLDSSEQTVQCTNCAATFKLGAGVHADECSFCGTPVVLGTGHLRSILPQALLPFTIPATQAKQYYRNWLKSLWFAPSALKKYARDDTPLNGVYIPYWTYDSDTTTSFSGLRGDIYYVRQTMVVIERGRRVRRNVSVPKIRWTPVNGQSARHFDDVLIGATRTLPRQLTDWLGPWGLSNLIAYQEEYLSGFRSEIYQVDLDEGFQTAQHIMDSTIRSDVRHRIGGDHQQIQRLNTQHNHTTFKHILLPIWTAAFQFRSKTYRFVINGRSGKTRGERPYSVVKIAFTVIFALLVLLGVGFVAEQSSALNGSSSFRYR